MSLAFENQFEFSETLTNNDLLKIIQNHTNCGLDLRIEWFLPPQHNALAFGNSVVNIQHPLVKMMIRCSLALRKAERERSLSSEVVGQLWDTLAKLQSCAKNEFSTEMWKTQIDACVDAFAKANLLHFTERPSTPAESDFISETINLSDHTLSPEDLKPDQTDSISLNFGIPIWEAPEGI